MSKRPAKPKQKRKVPAKAKARSLPAMIREHLGTDPLGLPVVLQTYQKYERVNLHKGLQSVLSPNSELQAIGVITHHDHERPSLSRLAHESFGRHFVAGPPEYADLEVGPGQRQTCLTGGLLLVQYLGEPLVVLVTETSYPARVMLEAVARTRQIAEEALRAIGLAGWRESVLRGQVLSMAGDCHQGFELKFHELAALAPDQLILPDPVRDRLQRHTVFFAEHAERLKAAGRHIKRGILLHGPPGTGKTLSAMYLVAQMPGRTVLLLTGAGMGAIEEAGRLARLLQPVTIILEDVDLIGTERHHQSVGANAVLFELLNQMDGLSSDYDVLFVLTTNRPDVLEPALASRPGRIDQAIEIPLPDDACRARLIELYSRGMTVQLTDHGRWVAATKGASAAFIKELLRKAAVFTIQRAPSRDIVVTDIDVELALGELLLAGAMTRTLLGGAAAR